MNVAMNFSDGPSEIDKAAQNELTIQCQNQIKNAFQEVLYKIRQPQEPISTTNFGKWNRYDESLFLESARETLRKSNIYRLHKALELNDKNEDLEDMIKHLFELEVLAYKYVYILYYCYIS